MAISQTVKEKLADSSWVTDAWDWTQQLLARTVPAVLFVTMIITSYGVIPGTPPVIPSVGITAFVLQFIALDIGGVTLDQTAKRRRLPVRSIPRITGLSLIATTLITLIYAGIQRACPGIDPQITTVVEVTLVVIRSGMTLFYGYAIHALKTAQEIERDQVAELLAQVNDLQQQITVKGNEARTMQQQLDSQQGQAAGILVQLDEKKNEIARLQSLLTNEKKYSASLQQDLASGNGDVSAMRRGLQSAQNEAEGLHDQLEGKQKEIDLLKSSITTGQEASLQVIHLSGENAALELQNRKLQDALETANSETARLQKASANSAEQAAKLTANEHEIAALKLQVQTANRTANDLQMTCNLQSEKLQKATAKLEKLQSANLQNGPAKETAKITPIESLQSARNRVSPEEILAYMDSNPGVKRAAVATHFGVSERTIYNATAKVKQEEEENAV